MNEETISTLEEGTDWTAWDNSDFDDLFDVNDDENGQTVVELLVTIQAIGTNEEVDFVVDSDTKWRPYMFCNEENMEPFSAWVEADSPIDKALIGYGEKAAHIFGTFRFFSDKVYGNAYECTVDSISVADAGDKAYRVFGMISAISKGNLTLDVYTVDASTCTPITYPMTFAFSESYTPEEYADLDVGDYVNLLLYRTASEEKEGKDPTILGIVSIYDESEAASAAEAISDGDAEAEYFNKIKFTKLSQAPLYSVFSNNLTAVTGVYDLSSDDYKMDGAAPYYEEGGAADGSFDGDYSLISTIEYDQGVLCDIPGQNEMYDEEAEKDKSISAWVYQDGTIQDVQNREYYMPIINNISQTLDEGGEGMRNFIDPLYHSYLAVGMSDNHYSDCELTKHYTSNGNGTHVVMCDDYIVHDLAEECCDEDGESPAFSGKPCQYCGYTPNGLDVLRLYNPATSEHLWTTSHTEYRELSTNQGWDGEKVAWVAVPSDDENAVGVYRLYNAGLGVHHYTASENEARTLVEREGWAYDHHGEPIFWAYPKDSELGRPVYRLYNEGLRQHHLTVSENESKTLSKLDWVEEGVAFRVQE